jgi:hypothetical protein
LPRIAELWENVADDGPTILAVNGHPTHMMSRVIAPCGALRIILTKGILYSSHLAQPLDLGIFGLFKMIDRKENQNTGMKRAPKRSIWHHWCSTKAVLFQWFGGVLNEREFT